MANLKQGMTGSEVKELQQKLIDAGYNVGSTKADGVFGKNTLKAVQEFQRDNKLTVDGIAGKNTLGALNSLSSNKSNTGSNTSKTGSNTNADKIVASNVDKNKPAAGTAKVDEPKVVTSPAGFTYGDFSYAEFDPMANEQIKQAWDILAQNNANKPGEFTDPNNYKGTYMGYLNQYENRDPFSYDFNSDALYQQYKDQYVLQGQMAMMDTMGQAAALTGGYGSSYAQTVGQQAYNQQLGQLNEIMPELYGMAYDRYTQEGQDLLNMYNTYLGLYQNDYGMHQDTVDRWYQENAMLTDNYNTAYSRGYDDYLLGYNTALGEYETDRSEEFSKWQTQQDQEFTATENQKTRDFNATEADKDRTAKEKESNYNRLANLIQSAGYNPSKAELNAAGMTSAEASALKDSYTASQTEVPEYNKLEVGTAAYKTITNAIRDTTSLGELKDKVKEWVALGYDPDQIEALTAAKLRELSPQATPGRVGTTGVGGGPSGGTMYWEIK